mmetsp:Transcript_64229/g.191743  ORF Transcript_64229/g.191743 Transcript_64229/m.191743 type:complete len:250 (+) Transcript_64229:1218-1967(+)
MRLKAAVPPFSARGTALWITLFWRHQDAGCTCLWALPSSSSCKRSRQTFRLRARLASSVVPRSRTSWARSARGRVLQDACAPKRLYNHSRAHAELSALAAVERPFCATPAPSLGQTISLRVWDARSARWATPVRRVRQCQSRAQPGGSEPLPVKRAESAAVRAALVTIALKAAQQAFLGSALWAPTMQTSAAPALTIACPVQTGCMCRFRVRRRRLCVLQDITSPRKARACVHVAPSATISQILVQRGA